MNVPIVLLIVPLMLLAFVALTALLALLERIVPGLTEWLDRHIEPPGYGRF